MDLCLHKSWVWSNLGAKKMTPQKMVQYVQVGLFVLMLFSQPRFKYFGTLSDMTDTGLNNAGLLALLLLINASFYLLCSMTSAC